MGIFLKVVILIFLSIFQYVPLMQLDVHVVIFQCPFCQALAYALTANSACLHLSYYASSVVLLL